MAKITWTVLLCLFAAGCSPVMVSLPYNPATTAEINANIEVDKFEYQPSKPEIKQNQIRTTAMGTTLLTENVDDFFTNAVKREFRQAGISLKPGAKCKVAGEVNDFAVDDLGYSATYITNVHYSVMNSNGAILYDNIEEVKFNTSKFVVAQVIYANLNKVISDNINKLLTNPDFINVVSTKCVSGK